MSTSPSSARSSADNDVYTVLIVVAFLFLLTATVFVGYKAQTMFGTILPPAGG